LDTIDINESENKNHFSQTNLNDQENVIQHKNMNLVRQKGSHVYQKSLGNSKIAVLKNSIATSVRLNQNINQTYEDQARNN